MSEQRPEIRAPEVGPNKLDLLLEAEKRGLLDQQNKDLLGEARKRGLIPSIESMEPQAQEPAETGGAIAPIPTPGRGVMQEGLEPEAAPLPQPPEPPPIEEVPTTLQFPAEIPPVIRDAADAGIVFDKPAPTGHALASFSFKQKDRIRAFEMTLARHFGQPVEVRVGDRTGALEYRDPTTNRFTLVAPPGDFQFGELAGPGVVFGSELAASIPASVLGPLSASFGAGTGAAIGEMTRLMIGRNAGINRDLTDNDIIKAMVTEAAFATGGGIATEKALRTAKWLVDIVNSRGVTPGLLKQLDIPMREAQQIERAINDRIDAARFRFSLGQASGDEDILALEDFFKRSREFSKIFGEFRQNQRAALKEFRANINKPFRSRLDDAETAQAVRNVADQHLDRTVRRADVSVALKEAELDNALTSLRSRPLERLGETLRNVGDAEQEAFNAWARDGARNLNELAGGAEFIPNKAIHIAAGELDERARLNLFASLVRSERALLGQRVEGQVEVPEALRTLRETVTGEPQPQFEDVLGKLFDPNAQFTFLELWDSISALKRAARVSAKGLSTDEPSVGAIKKLISAAERDLREGTANSPLREQYEQFIARYRAEKLRLDEGTVAAIMTRQGGSQGRFRVADEDVFRTVFQPGGIREAEEIFALVRNDPEAMTAMRETIADFYKRQVVREGRINIRAHEQFMEQYRGPMGVFFSRNEMREIARPGQIERALQAREAARKRAVDGVNKTFAADIANLRDVDALVRFGTRDVSAARDMVSLLQNTPDVLRAYRAAVRKDMAQRIAGEFIDGERVLSAPKMTDFLFGKAGEKGKGAVLAATFGDQYVSDLVTLQRAITIAGRESTFPNRSNTAFWTQTVKNLARAYVGLFTRPGRFITALDRIRGRAANRVFVNAILNPQDLRRLMEMRGVDLRTRKAASVVGALGGSALLQEFE